MITAQYHYENLQLQEIQALQAEKSVYNQCNLDCNVQLDEIQNGNHIPLNVNYDE